MSANIEVESSLLWARLRDIAHREHPQHKRLHRRQDIAAQTTAEATTEATATEPSTSSIDVTQATVTVSYIQQIDVDTDGNTLAVQTVLADSTGSSNSSAISTTDTNTQSLSTTQSSISSNSSITDSSTPLSTSGFPSLIVSNNNTIGMAAKALLSSSADQVPGSSGSSSRSNYLNTTTSSSPSTTSLSSTTPLTSTTLSTDSSTGSSSTFDESSATSIDYDGGIFGGSTETAGGLSPQSTSHKGSGSESDSDSGSAPSTPVVVGSVCGAIAGAAMILLLLLLIFRRWKKHHGKTLSLACAGPAPGALEKTPSGPPNIPPEKPKHRSAAFAVPAALASLTGYKRSSQKTERTVSSNGSEVGFYRVSGRKLPSVWHHGGDGYGGGANPDHLSETSFYRDSTGFHGGVGSPLSSPIEIRESGVPVMRPSPARTPVTEQGPFIDPPPPRPDALGRSHPSQDGSHASKFMEEV